MSSSSLKIMFRSLWRKKTFSLLNILGLAVGIAACLLIFLVISHELSYDNFHPNKNRIYRVVSTLTSPGREVERLADVPLPLAAAVRQEFPQLEQVAHVWKIGGTQFAIPGTNGAEKKFKEDQHVYYTTPAFFHIFNFKWLQGDADNALKDPYTIVLTKKVADSYFGSWQAAVGKTIYQGDSRKPYKVTGILDNFPSNTDMPMRIVLSYATFAAMNADALKDPNAWGGWNSASNCYILLGKGQTAASVDAQMPAFAKRHYASLVGKMVGTPDNHLQALKDIHLSTDYGTYGGQSFNKKELFALGLIGLFLLLVACINFINLSTAQSVNRSKEIGVRKVLGSNRGQLMWQFLGETAMVTGIALLLACLLAEVFMPSLRNLLGKQIEFNLTENPGIALFLLATGVVVTFLAGFYPGLVLSGFDPVAAIKSKISAKTVGGISLRRGLVVMQFVIAQLLIIGTLVVVKQMNYFRNRPLGFDKSAVALIDIPNAEEGVKKFPLLKASMKNITGVEDVTLCNDAPSSDGAWNTTFYYDHDLKPKDFTTIIRQADVDFMQTFRMTLAAGRIPYPSDTIKELLLNETMVKKLGIVHPEDILGREMGFGDGLRRYTIVGVMRDFNSMPLRQAIGPLVMITNIGEYNTLAVRLDPKHLDETMKRIQTTYTTVFPDHVFDYIFFDDAIVNFYHGETITSTLFKIFAVLAIFISCLGLYGLVAFMAIQKTKEVGIRKVLGASLQSIVVLFSKEFTLLIGISFVISAPLGYFFMHKWLADFYYRTNIGWGVFVAAIVLSLAIAWITVGYKAVQAAMANPVKSLKSE